MADKSNDAEMKAAAEQKEMESADTGEYGVEQILADEDALSEARQTSSYHFSQEQLEHKQDPVENMESRT